MLDKQHIFSGHMQALGDSLASARTEDAVIQALQSVCESQNITAGTAPIDDVRPVMS